MAGVTYKCPNCGAYLTFDPDSQQWKCPFCSSAFPETELKGKAEAFQKEADKEAEQSSGAQVVYHCPSCGSEIMNLTPARLTAATTSLPPILRNAMSAAS